MACSDIYPARALDHVTDEMLSELAGRTCPRCGCGESRPVDSDREMARLPLRVCVACHDVFGFDDSTPPERRPPSDDDNASCGSGVWNRYDDVDDREDPGPRTSSPCSRDAEWSSGNEDRRRNDDRCPESPDDCGQDPGHGGRRHGGGRGRGHHRHEEDRPHHRHRHGHRRSHHGGRGHRDQRGGSGDGGGAHSSSSSGGDAGWKQVAGTCLQSSKCLLGAASSLVSGDYDGAVGTVSGEMEPVGRVVGSALGSVAGGVIRSSRAGEIGAEMGSVVGRGVAEMLKDSSLCSRRPSSGHD